MNCPILNRNFEHPADGWYHIEPKGEFPNEEAGVVQVIDDSALQTIVNRFNEAAGKPNFPGLLIDHEHFQHQQDKESIAYGWLTHLQNRADGLYGKVRWTETGQRAVDGGDYRFFSTEYKANEAVILNRRESPKRLRPQRLSGLTLTNSPNNKGAKPITNRAPAERQADETKQSEQTMKSVAQTLGLAPEASEPAILDAVQVLNRRATTAEKELETTRTQLKEANDKNASFQKARVDDAMASLDAEPIKNRVTDAHRGAFRKQLEADFESGKLILDGFVGGLTQQATSGKTPAPTITNRSSARTPQDTQTTGAQDEKSKALIFNRKVTEYKATHKVSHAEADRAIAEAHPELLPEMRSVAE